MDIKINNTEKSGETTLEYNIIGGVLDFYFLAGGEDPVDTAKQYSEVVGTPAEVPYWSFGLHQCRYGYTGECFYLNMIVTKIKSTDTFL